MNNRRSQRRDLRIQQKHIHSHEHTTTAEIPGFPETEQLDLNSGGGAAVCKSERKTETFAIAHRISLIFSLERTRGWFSE